MKLKWVYKQHGLIEEKNFTELEELSTSIQNFMALSITQQSIALISMFSIEFSRSIVLEFYLQREITSARNNQ